MTYGDGSNDYYYTYGSGSGTAGDYYYSDDGQTYYYSDDGYDYLLDGGYSSYTYGSGGGYGGGSGWTGYEGCENDDSVGDSYEDTCTDYYDANPDQCGNYDTDTFVAADLCCACYGTGSSSTTTYTYGNGTGYGYGTGYGGGSGWTGYEGCENDDSVGDSFEDTCTDYYDANPDQCGNYDTETFIAADLCCACYGTGSYSTTSYTYGNGTGYGSGGYNSSMYGYGTGYGYGGGSGWTGYEGCENDDSVGDSFEDTCTDYYDANPDQCGNYDTDTFVAADLCCACYGTGSYSTTSYTYGNGTGYGSGGYGYGTGYGGGSGWTGYEGCENDDSVGDSFEDTCTDYYDANPDQCGNYDTETFIAADLCCACYGTGSYSTTSYTYGNGTGYGSGSGYGYGTGYGYGGGSGSGSGEYETGAIEDPTPVVYDGCENDDSLTDSFDDTCTEWYDANPSTCG